MRHVFTHAVTVGLVISSIQAHALTPHDLSFETRQVNESFSTLHFQGAELLRTNAKGDIMEILDRGGEPENWFNLSPMLDGIQGVGTELAYQEFGAPKHEVVVAVIDSGVDVNHEDLQGKVWVNNNEIPNNGIDDDGNGYVDDIFGWNFIGNEKGKARVVLSREDNGFWLIKGNPEYQVHGDTLAITRELVRLEKLGSPSPKEIQQLKKLQSEIHYRQETAKGNLEFFEKIDRKFAAAKATLRKAGLKFFDEKSVKQFQPSGNEEAIAKEDILSLIYRGWGEKEIEHRLKRYFHQAYYHYNKNSDTRAEIVKDDQQDLEERHYGNNDVIGPDSSHGTHVAGIIAASRDNKIGIKGVASNVKIMAIRAIPDGDERDKDVANAIYYAVDNGAKIINMSFGKNLSPHKGIVDKAVEYAEANGVLLVHAAGNDGKDNDKQPGFPNKELGGREASNWIEVAASTFREGPYLAASFSNYGNSSVDVFAPGQNIRATFPNNTYQTISGTSMASPVVAGIAAVLLGHYPDLSPAQVRDAIMASASSFPGLTVFKRGLGAVLFESLSLTGGIANLLRGLSYATNPPQVPLRPELAQL